MDVSSINSSRKYSSSTAATTISSAPPPEPPSRYESQKRRDWNTFKQYLQNRCRPPLSLPLCSGAHVVEFLKYLDQFGKTRVHSPACPFFGQPSPPSPCPCPLKQAWGSLDSIVGRLRAAFEEDGGRPENNPFGSMAVRIYLKEIRDFQERARGVSYDKKKKQKQQQQQQQLRENPAADRSTTSKSLLSLITVDDHAMHEGSNWVETGEDP